jgi:hypothetical protein
MATVCQLIGRVVLNIRHIGIIFSVIFSVIGTTLLAISIGIKSGGGWIFSDIAPTETYIKKWLFWLGLVFIAIGSIMQFMQW